MSNPLMKKLQLPGIEFQLPSAGVLYPVGVLDPKVKNGEVQIHPLSTHGELKLKSPDLLFSGRAMIEVIEECVPEVLDASKLFGKDVDALFVAIRQVTHGNQFSITAQHNCEHGKQHNYEISLDELLGRSQYLQPQDIESYQVKLSNDQLVKFRPLTIPDVIEMQQKQTALLDTPESFTYEKLKDSVTTPLVRAIYDVDGTTDSEMITEWLGALHLNLKKELSDAITSPKEFGVDLKSQFRCIECGQAFDVALPLNPSTFFSV